MTATKARMTSQRRLIFEALKASVSHPTAYDIYAMVSERLPQISLATVYRNLDALCRSGEASCVDIAGAQRRFDGQATPHYHVRCASCGAVSNVDMARMPAVEDLAKSATDYRILGHSIDFAGVCPRCAEQTIAQAAQPMAVLPAGPADARANDSGVEAGA